MNCKLYYNSAAIPPAVWAELTNCTDVTLNMEGGEADVTTRANTGWRATVGTLKEGTLEFTMFDARSGTASTQLDFIVDAFLTNTPVEFLVLNGELDQATTKGLRATFAITAVNNGQPLEEGASFAITCKITSAATPPDWVTGPITTTTEAAAEGPEAEAVAAGGREWGR
jgi:hypothetical protein